MSQITKETYLMMEEASKIDTRGQSGGELVQSKLLNVILWKYDGMPDPVGDFQRRLQDLGSSCHVSSGPSSCDSQCPATPDTTSFSSAEKEANLKQMWQILCDSDDGTQPSVNNDGPGKKRYPVRQSQNRSRDDAGTQGTLNIGIWNSDTNES